MRVFVTGSTGFVGSAVVRELLSSGHTVLGLTRGDKGAKQLKSQGAEALHGTIEDLNVLKQGASQCDAVIHLAFNHDFADFVGSCATDRTAITALGDALADAGGDRALVITSGTMMLPFGKVGDEDDGPDMNNPLAAARGASEAVCLDFAKKGVRASVVRLPPTTHGAGSSGFLQPLISTALQKGACAYVGEGENHMCAGNVDDAARVFRLAAEKAQVGGRNVFHAVGEERVTLKAITEEIGRVLSIPVVSLPKEEAEGHFGQMYFVALADNMASSEKTKERLGWNPTGPTVIEDIPVAIKFIKSQAA